MKYYSNKNTKGFTIIELMISVGIFAMMTSLLLAKYGNFNQGILLTNLAYDVALTIRNAQSYGLNVKSAVRNDNRFEYPYGVNFTTGKTFIFFADVNITPDFVYDEGADINLSKTTIRTSSFIDKICVGTPTCTDVLSLDIAFKRPNPDAIINGVTANSYAEIVLKASDGSTKKVIVRSTGQIAVTN